MRLWIVFIIAAMVLVGVHAILLERMLKQINGANKGPKMGGWMARGVFPLKLYARHKQCFPCSKLRLITVLLLPAILLLFSTGMIVNQNALESTKQAPVARSVNLSK